MLLEFVQGHISAWEDCRSWWGASDCADPYATWRAQSYSALCVATQPRSRRRADSSTPWKNGAPAVRELSPANLSAPRPWEYWRISDTRGGCLFSAPPRYGCG